MSASKILQWFLYLLLIISAILGVLFYLDIVTSDLLIYWGYALVIATAVITIIAPLITSLFNPKGALKFLIMLGIIVVIAIISYFLSYNEFNAIYLEAKGITETTSKVIGAGLYITYALMAIAILAIVYATISRIFK